MFENTYSALKQILNRLNECDTREELLGDMSTQEKVAIKYLPMLLEDIQDELDRLNDL